MPVEPPRIVEIVDHGAAGLPQTVAGQIGARMHLMDERADIAIRWGRLQSSDLVARLLGHTRQLIVGSPDYLQRHGVPTTKAELAQHNRLGTNYRRLTPDWPLRDEDGKAVDLPIVGNVRAADGETLRYLALEGVGLARLSVYHSMPTCWPAPWCP